MGKTSHGRLGLPETESYIQVPTLVEELSHLVIVSVSCGAYHTLAVDKGGVAYSWGKGEMGALGLGHTKACQFPTRVKI